MSSHATPDRRPNEHVQVLVVGFGAAGAAAAITARNLGASVVVLEKQPENAHTPNTRMSGGMIMGVTDVEAAAAYLDVCAGGMVPYAVSRAWADQAYHLRTWLSTVAPELPLTSVGIGEQREVPGVDAIDVLQPGTSSSRLDASSGAGPALFAALRESTLRHGADVRWGMPAHRLQRSTKGAVPGSPRRDEFGRVLDTYGNPIDGLYAAGELGQAVGLRYPSDGSNISEALCFGQIAALSAIKR